ncbi:hypothetical protein XELAEV_180299851mg, partial [Xenopus laevis]
MLPGAPDPQESRRRRRGKLPGPGLWCWWPLLLSVLLQQPEKAHSGPGPSTDPGLNLYLSEEEVRRLIGLDAELYYIRNDIINHYALSFNLLVPSETNSLHFTWHSKSKVEYKLGFQVDNPIAMTMPLTNISMQGEVPSFLT